MPVGKKQPVCYHAVITKRVAVNGVNRNDFSQEAKRPKQLNGICTRYWRAISTGRSAGYGKAR